MSAFLAGVVEGFYGRPWSRDQRETLFERMRDWGLNTYGYCPKDDLKHRACWRDCYDRDELASLEETIAAAHRHGLTFFYGLGPGLDVRYAEASEVDTMVMRFQQVASAGGRHFALLFDDIADAMRPEDRERFGSFAAAHSHVANAVLERIRPATGADSRFLFCPTPYCGRMDAAGLGGAGYLDEIGERVHPAIDIFWTGPEIISRTISRSHADGIARRLRRRPLLWDNLHANDYDQTRVFTGPFSGRAADPREAYAGILLNPNCEFEANFVPLRTMAACLRGETDAYPDAYAEALAGWLPAFDGVGEPWSLEELRLLAAVYYLPHEDGEPARELVSVAADLVEREPGEPWDAQADRFRQLLARVDAIAVKLTELKNRELFYTFNRRWWDLREEMHLLNRYFEWKRAGGAAAHPAGGGGEFRSPEHLAGNFRGGTVRRLQRLLVMTGGGGFVPGAGLAPGDGHGRQCDH